MNQQPPQPDLEFQAFLSQGRFMIQRSRSTGGYVFYPRVMEPGTGAMDLDWVAASGKGVVYASTTVRVKPPGADYNVCIVDLAEGPRMMSRVDGIDPCDVRAGLIVEAHIVTEADQPLIVFRPA